MPLIGDPQEVQESRIFDPNAADASATRRAQLDFETQNAYYVGKLIINHEDGTDDIIEPSDPRVRGYRPSVETDLAIDWIEDTRQQKPDTPWMLTIGYSPIHAPLQPPPASLLPHPDATLSLAGCGTPLTDQLAELGGPVKVNDIANFAESRAVVQHMLEALDHEVGRLLEETGIAVRDEGGALRYDPRSNTLVVIVADNGTYAPSVKLPFDSNRSKGTPYQTGVWVPLVVAGPEDIVSDPGREVEAMVNVTDLFNLFGEVAGIDMAEVHDNRKLDSKPLLPYLTDPGQQPIRQTNFTGVGANLKTETPPPCVIPSVNTCVTLFPQEAVCLDQGGVWYGPGNPDAPTSDGFPDCCAVNAHLEAEGDEPVDVYPRSQRSLRNDRFKLVRLERKSCDTGDFTTTDEFYEINQDKDESELKLDKEEDNLLADGTLTPEQQANYGDLKQKMSDLLASDVDCPGDGNGDLRVDQQDLDEWAKWSTENGGRSSWYDLNHDGLTGDDDKLIIEQNLGTVCAS